MKQNLALTLVTAFATAQDGNSPQKESPEKAKYLSYMALNNKSYKSLDKFDEHMKKWKEADLTINQLNSQAQESGKSYKAGHNFSSDLTAAELLEFTGREKTEPALLRRLQAQPVIVNAPTNHVKAGFTTPVKSQGKCGSCYVMAANTTLEAAIALQKGVAGSAVRISEQEGLDCSGKTNYNIATFGKSYGNYSCSGGLEYNLWNFQKDWGAMAASTYTYVGALQQCKRIARPANLLVPVGKVTGWERVAQTVTALSTRVKTAPVSVGLNASCAAYQYYQSGIITQALCPGGSMNHSNSVVGIVAGNATCTIGDSWNCETVPSGGSYYWLVQNSWGTGWGEKGFARFEMAEGYGVASMNLDATYPILAP